jgi:hypothetical protein
MSVVKKEEKDEAAPFHVLMMACKRPIEELLVRDDLIQRDYLAKRFQIVHSGEKEVNMWSAVLPIERAMIECCQLNDGEIRASLQRGKELDFCRLLAMHCHTAATRGLAVAILEKTMEQDALEAPVIVVEQVEEDKVEDGDAPDTINVTKSDDDITTDSKPLVKQEEHESNNTNIIDVYLGRMNRFLQAGGLNILKRWLIDAMTPIKTYNTKPDSPSTTTNPQQPAIKALPPVGTRVVTTTASPTGPLLLPLLQILTDMPFDKQLIMSCKINKQIKKLRKQLDQAISARRSNRTDTKLWTDPVAGGLVVDHVETAVSKLMESWQQTSKPAQETSKKSRNPFEALQEKMKHRCELLKEYEVGDGEKPFFLEKFEQEEQIKREAQMVSKLSVEQRAARERQQEREQMLKVVKQKQSEAKAKMDALLKKRNEETRKRKAEGTVVHEKKRIRRVRWKDGSDSYDNPKKKHLLVQVHVYTSESDVVDEYDEAVKQEDEENDEDGIPFADDDTDDSDDTGAKAVKQEES